MQKSKGFTLVELVIVIVILGILSAVALPRLINLKDEAYVSSIKGTVAAINSTNVMVYAKTALSGMDVGASVMDIGDLKGVHLMNGFLAADPLTISAVLSLNAATSDDLSDVKGKDWILTPIAATETTPARVNIRQAGAPLSCNVIYTAASRKGVPSFTVRPTAEDC